MDPRAKLLAATFENDIKKISKGKISILSPYKSSKEKVNCICQVCRHKWSAIPSSLKKGHGCAKCASRLNSANIQSKFALTFEQEINRIHKGTVSVLSPYKSAKDKVKCRCNLCGIIWQITPDKLKSGHGCGPCAIRKHQEKKIQRVALTFERDINKKHKGKIILLSTYNSAKEKVKCQCKICGNIWMVTADNIKSKSGCPKCKFDKLNSLHAKRSTIVASSFLKDIQTIHKGRIEILTNYNRSNIKVKCLCRNCGGVWQVTPKNLKKGRGCPKCAKFGFDQTKKAYLYLNLIELITGKKALKFGITNNEVKFRIRQQKRHIEGILKPLFVWEFEGGEIALKCEHKISKNVQSGFLELNEMKDGFTETVEYSEKNILIIKDIVNKHLSKYEKFK